MKFKFTEKDISTLKVVSQVAAGFALIVALTMIFSLVQLKTVNPLDNPVLLSVKEQYDKDPSNAANAEQVRAMDLMARKAYFSSRWQVETGSYLLLAGAIVFIICQRLITENEKLNPVLTETKPVSSLNREKKQKISYFSIRCYFYYSNCIFLFSSCRSSGYIWKINGFYRKR